MYEGPLVIGVWIHVAIPVLATKSCDESYAESLGTL
jgi:hypothetical protein